MLRVVKGNGNCTLLYSVFVFGFFLIANARTIITITIMNAAIIVYTRLRGTLCSLSGFGETVAEVLGDGVFEAVGEDEIAIEGELENEG